MEQVNKETSFYEIFIQFLYIGAISFGGGIIAYVHELAVKKMKWLTEDEFLLMLSISQTMPGLNSVNMSILIGDKLRGGLGSIIAALAMCLPGAIIVMVLGIFYIGGGDHPLVNKFLTGVTAGATALLAIITFRLGHRSFETIKPLLIAGITFFLMSVLKIQLVLVILIVLPLALFIYRPMKEKKG